MALRTPAGPATVELPLPGLYNVYNSVAAAATALELGVPLTTVKGALESFGGAFGRVETIPVEGRDVSILLQDYGQLVLVPLSGRRLMVGEPEPIDDSPAGTAFLHATTVEVPRADGVRMYLPLLDGSDQVGGPRNVTCLQEHRRRRPLARTRCCGYNPRFPGARTRL